METAHPFFLALDKMAYKSDINEYFAMENYCNFLKLVLFNQKNIGIFLAC